MPDFPIVDTHLHLWDPHHLRYPWLDEVPILNRKYLLPDYNKACDPVRVESMVFVQCEADFSQAMDEANWISSLAQQEPRIKGIVPWAPLEKGEGAREFLEIMTQNPLIKGIRRIIQFEPDMEFCLRPDFVKGVRMLSEFNLSFDICISHVHLANTIRMVEQCPQVPFILDHIGKPNIKDRIFEPWKTELRSLAGFENVYCKMSGLVVEADHHQWTRENLKPYIDHVLECFGLDRVMFGGDWPVVIQAAEYTRWVETLEWAVNGCSEAERIKLFHDNAIEFYRLDEESCLGNTTA